MTVKGRIERGVVVLDQPGVIPDGVEVEVSPITRAQAPVGEALAQLAGQAEELPCDLAEKHDEHRRKRPQ